MSKTNVTTKNTGKILPKNDLEIEAYGTIQDYFTSSLIYFDVKKIKAYLENKIIPNLQHFYILMHGYIGTKARLNNEKAKCRRDDYRYYVEGDEKYGKVFKNSDFYFNYMCEDLINILKIFALNGFVFGKEVYSTLIFLNIDVSQIDHLFTINQTIKNEIKLKYDGIFKIFVNDTHKVKTKHALTKIGSRTMSSLEKMCRTNPLADVLECKINGKKLKFTKDCMRNSLFNHHQEVFEYFCYYGYVPTIDDINLFFRIEKRFLFLLRFHPQVLNTNDIKQTELDIINTSIDADLKEDIVSKEKVVKELEQRRQKNNLKSSPIPLNYKEKWDNNMHDVYDEYATDSDAIEKYSNISYDSGLPGRSDEFDDIGFEDYDIESNERESEVEFDLPVKKKK